MFVLDSMDQNDLMLFSIISFPYTTQAMSGLGSVMASPRVTVKATGTLCLHGPV